MQHCLSTKHNKGMDKRLHPPLSEERQPWNH